MHEKGIIISSCVGETEPVVFVAPILIFHWEVLVILVRIAKRWRHHNEKIGKVKMTMGKDMIVNVHADVHMKNANDRDDLYFVLFNIMADPLRLSIGTVGTFESLGQVAGHSPESLSNLLNTQPDDYMRLVQQHYTDLVSVSSEEKVKVVLDNQRNADSPYGYHQPTTKWVLRTNYDLYYSGSRTNCFLSKGSNRIFGSRTQGYVRHFQEVGKL